jgi:predicted acylesterase/phospholipase RssA
MIRRLLFAWICVLAFPAPALAKEALVLSGGGARGLAHIGAVVGYENSGHDADIVVGTSMGAIVGGFYAAGYAPATIESIFVAQDWRQMFTPLPLPVGPSRGLRYPVLRLQSEGDRYFTTPGYVPDWRINRKLTRYLFDASARARGNFDRLPRPFRSMTADLETGNLVPLASGDLARAIRASMAASGFFEPVRWKDHLLTDGGMADYLPVDEPRKLGATTVIAVDVLRPPAKLENPGAIAVARRTVELMTLHVRKEQTPPDVLILPQLPVGLAPYTYPTDPSPTIRAGYAATMEALGKTEWAPHSRPSPALKPDSEAAPRGDTTTAPPAVTPPPAAPDSVDDDERDFGLEKTPEPDGDAEVESNKSAARDSVATARPEPAVTGQDTLSTNPSETRETETPETVRAEGVHAAQPPPPEIGALTIEDVTGPLAPFLNRAFAEVAPGPYRKDRILTVVDRLYATGLFDGIWVSVEDNASAPALIVRTENRGPVALSGAVGYDNDRGGKIWASIRRVGIFDTHPLETGLEISVDGVERWFAVPIRVARRDGHAWTAGAWFGETEAPFFPPYADPENPETQRSGGWLGFEARQIEPDLSGSLILRAENIDADLGPDGGSWGVSGRAGVTAPLVTVIGTPIEASVDLRAGRAEYWSARVKGSVSRRLGPLQAAPLVDFTAVSTAAPLDVIPAAGNDGLVPGLRTGERRGRVRAVGGLDLAANGPASATIRLRLRGARVLDEARLPEGDVHDPLIGSKDVWLGGAGLGALWWTPFGRIEVGVEAGTLGDRRFVVALGPDF